MVRDEQEKQESRLERSIRGRVGIGRRAKGPLATDAMIL